ncbi:MAG: glutaredoxin 3 [Methylocystis sp.]|jgi:glutaredoxin 3|nr:glutaredoxin 3 [Methylocystis sp.]MCA3582740.1 glutaredoxin 3 [Methylocystis sp.]MCA3587054.1 glutaredoxin 3 [Methylocystis sp.]MCA3592037.1 glutaredoxin 3 [Methylocystis sp.]
MPPVTIYTKSWCPYCSAAKELLKAKNVDFTEIAVNSAADQATMAKKAGGRSTVPQIWIGERHIGGCDDLHALDSKGELDRLLAA